MRKLLPWCLVAALALVATLWASRVLTVPNSASDADRVLRARMTGDPPPAGAQLATFGGGCFWCTEAIFQQLNGVYPVVSGYSGGPPNNPTYQQVCTGMTGHAEVIQVTFDPKVIPYEDLLEVFWRTHDPTTLNRQGEDSGTQYRSVVFYHTPEQMVVAEQYKQQLDRSGTF